MKPGSIANLAFALGAALLAASSVEAAAAEHYVAKLTPLNADKIGTSASGTANLEIVDGKLNVTIDLTGLSPNLMHLQHYHGFIDGKDAACPTAAADANGDGYVDLIETEPTSGVTMLPFHAHPATLEIANDTYPVADKSGAAHYTHTDDVATLDKALKEKLKATGLELSKRVIIVHGVPTDTKLPDTVKSLPGVPAQITIPVACGKIEVAK
jgi:hypothetical protein